MFVSRGEKRNFSLNGHWKNDTCAIHHSFHTIFSLSLPSVPVFEISPFTLSSLSLSSLRWFLFLFFLPLILPLICLLMPLCYSRVHLVQDDLRVALFSLSSNSPLAQHLGHRQIRFTLFFSSRASLSLSLSLSLSFSLPHQGLVCITCLSHSPPLDLLYPSALIDPLNDASSSTFFSLPLSCLVKQTLEDEPGTLVLQKHLSLL